MGKLLSYSIVSGLIMFAMYLVYKLFIARENQHNFNRGVLLLIYLVSFCACPIYNYVYNYVHNPTVGAATMPIVNVVEIDNFTWEVTEQLIWGTILIWIFIIGALIVAVKTIVTWIRIVVVIRSGEKIKKNGYTLVVIDKES